jgi:hypothetical protein
MTPADKDAERNPAPEDVRRKFREALERKQGKRDEHLLAGPDETGQARTGPVKPQRTFRRKSG